MPTITESTPATTHQDRIQRLEYTHAFDLAFAFFAQTSPPHSPLLLIATHPSFVDETLARTSSPVMLHPAGRSLATYAETQAQAWNRTLALWETTEESAGSPVEKSDRDRPFTAALWAAPQRDTWRETLDVFHRAMDIDGIVVILTSGPLGACLPAHPGEPRWVATPVSRELRHRGYRPLRTVVLGGLRALAWAVRRRLASQLGRDDLADRAEAAYRQQVVADDPRDPARYQLRFYRREQG